MTMQITLTSDLQIRLNSAASLRGKSADQLALEILEDNLPPSEKNLAAARMLLDWAEEDAAMSDSESAANEAILRAIDEDRLSDRKLFAHLRAGDPS